MPPKKREHQPKPVQEFEQPKEHGLYVYADFETFKAGDKFDIPTGWKRDQAYEDLLLTKAKARQGMVFVTPEKRDEKGNLIKDSMRVTLPVMEV